MLVDQKMSKEIGFRSLFLIIRCGTHDILMSPVFIYQDLLASKLTHFLDFVNKGKDEE